MADTETFGLKIYLGVTGSPTTYSQIVGVLNYPSLFGNDRSLIDTSEIATVVKTFLAGQLDPGNVDFEYKFDPNEATHDDVTGINFTMLTRGRFPWCLEIPASTAAGSTPTYMYFEGITISNTPTGTQDDIIRATCSIKVSGQPDFTKTAPTVV